MRIRRTFAILAVVVATTIVAACGGDTPVGSGDPPQGLLIVTAVMGPTCPVVTPETEEECADRPVADAELRIRRADGSTWGTLRTDAGGRAEAELRAGTYTVEPAAVAEAIGGAAPIGVEIRDGQISRVTVYYDTGIR